MRVLSNQEDDQICKDFQLSREQRFIFENFTISLSGEKENDIENLNLDAQLYNWKANLVDSINKAINICYNE